MRLNMVGNWYNPHKIHSKLGNLLLNQYGKDLIMKTNNILITGGSSGIGFGLVNKFLEADYNVVTVARNITSLESIKNKTPIAIKKRILKKVNGSIYGNPNLAPIKSLLHKNANINGNIFSNIFLVSYLFLSVIEDSRTKIIRAI